MRLLHACLMMITAAGAVRASASITTPLGGRSISGLRIPWRSAFTWMTASARTSRASSLDEAWRDEAPLYRLTVTVAKSPAGHGRPSA